jgi:hypothetical protein
MSQYTYENFYKRFWLREGVWFEQMKQVIIEQEHQNTNIKAKTKTQRSKDHDHEQ